MYSSVPQVKLRYGHDELSELILTKTEMFVERGRRTKLMKLTVGLLDLNKHNVTVANVARGWHARLLSAGIIIQLRRPQSCRLIDNADYGSECWSHMNFCGCQSTCS